MKKAISILLLVCIALAAMFATSCKKSGNETTEAQAQTTTAEKPDPDIIDGVKKEYDEDGNMIKLSTYDENGRLINQSEYNKSGSMLYYCTYEYDDAGREIKYSYYTTDGGLNYYSTYEYDENGNIAKSHTYDANGKYESYCVNEYSDGKIVKRLCYNADGTLFEVQEYNENEDLVRTSNYYGDKLGSYTEYVYDENCCLLSKSDFLGDGTMYEHREYFAGTKFEDLIKNKEKETKYEFYKNGELLSRTISEYDKDGRIISSSECDGEGNLTYGKSFEYDENGKLIKASSYGKGGELRSVSEYTENSELVKSYGEGGKILGINEFDKKGNLTKWFEYDNNGELKRYYVYEYNSFNERTKTVEYNPDGTVIRESYR